MAKSKTARWDERARTVVPPRIGVVGTCSPRWGPPPDSRAGVDGGGDIVADWLSEERAAKEMLAKLRVSVLTHAHNEA